MASRSLRISISRKHYIGPDGPYWLWRVGIPVFDESGLPVRRIRRCLPGDLTQRQAEIKARAIQEYESGAQARAATKPRLLATMLAYYEQVTNGPQPKADATAALDWRVCRMVALWLEDRLMGACTPLESLGPVGEQGRLVKAVADRADIRLDEFKRAEAEGLRDYLARRLNATSANIYLRHLSSMMSWAVGRELLGRNPLDGMARLDTLKATAGGKAGEERRGFSASDVQALLAAAAGQADLQTFLGLLAWTAMRPGALILLTARHLRPGVLAVPGVKGQPSHEIPIVPPADPFVSAWRAAGCTWQHRLDWYIRQGRRLCDALGIRIHSPLYGFRHGFGSRAIEAGLPIRWVSRYMGHSSVTTTERWYDHSSLVPPAPPAPEMLAIAESIRAGHGQPVA